MAKQAFLCKYAEIGTRERIVINLRMHYANRSADDWQNDGEFTVVREQGRIFVEAGWRIMISRMRSMP